MLKNNNAYRYWAENLKMVDISKLNDDCSPLVIDLQINLPLGIKNNPLKSVPLLILH